jgi:hypothetical protein
MWTYWWYADPNPQAPDPWRSWYDAQNSGVRARHDNVFRFLEGRTSWAEPHSKKVGNLIEVILKGKVQHRLLGFYWLAGQCQFTFLLPCTHKEQVYKPRAAFNTAEQYRVDLMNGSNWIRRCVRPE